MSIFSQSAHWSLLLCVLLRCSAGTRIREQYAEENLKRQKPRLPFWRGETVHHRDRLLNLFPLVFQTERTAETKSRQKSQKCKCLFALVQIRVFSSWTLCFYISYDCWLLLNIISFYCVYFYTVYACSAQSLMGVTLPCGLQ